MSARIENQNASQLVELVLKSQNSLDNTLQELSRAIVDGNKVMPVRPRISSGVEVPRPVVQPPIQEVVETVKPPKRVVKKKKQSMISKGAGTTKTPAFHWLLGGAGDDDGYYIQRVIAGDKTLKLDEIMENLPEDVDISRSSMGRLTKEIRDGKYDSYIAEYIDKYSTVSIDDVYPYHVTVEKTGDGKGWTVKKGK